MSRRVLWRRLELRGFGRFGAGVGVSFEAGLNVLAAPNERGKSTLLAGLQAVLFGLLGGESRTAFSRGRFRSWSGEECAGCLLLEADGVPYLIRRDWDRQRVEVWEGPPAVTADAAPATPARPVVATDVPPVSPVPPTGRPRGWTQLLAGPHNPRGQRNDPRYEEWLGETLGLAERELFAATFCLGQAALPGGGEAFPAAGDGWTLPADVQILLAGSGGRTVAEALERLAAEVRELSMRCASRFGLPGSDQRKPRLLEALEERVAALEARFQAGRRSLDAAEGLRLELARLEAEEREGWERLDQLRRTEQAFAERRLALERLRAAEAEQARLDADWRAWEEGRARLDEARALLARRFPWATAVTAAPKEPEDSGPGSGRMPMGQRLAALCELARERERQAREEEAAAARRREAAAELEAARTAVRRWLGLEGDLPPDWRRLGEERLAVLRGARDGGRRAAAAGLGRAAVAGVVVGLGLAILGWLAGAPRGEAAGVLFALGSAVGFLAARFWLRRVMGGPVEVGETARGAGEGPARAEEWERLAAAVDGAQADLAAAAAAEGVLAERRHSLEERWRSLAEEARPLLLAHGDDPARALAAWNEWEAELRRTEDLTAAQAALLSRHGAGTGEELRGLLLSAGNEVQRRLRDWDELLERHPGLPGRDEPVEAVEESLRRIRAEAEAVQGSVSRAREEGSRLRRALAEAEAAGGENVARLELELQAARAELARAREEAAALALAHAELAGAYDEYRRQHRDRLCDLAGDHFAHLTAVPGRRVVLDEGFSVEVREPDGRRCAVSQLSRGAADQLALALRLAVADLLSADLVLPLHLDDPFGNFDAERLEEAGRLLQRVAEGRQVILVTHRDDLLSWGRPLQLAEPVLLTAAPFAAPPAPPAAGLAAPRAAGGEA